MVALRPWEKTRIDGVIWRINQSALWRELRSSPGGTVMTVTFVTREGDRTRLGEGPGMLGGTGRMLQIARLSRYLARSQEPEPR